MVDRYCRQTLLIGEEKQKRLASSSILVIGAGGVSSPLLLYLAGAGIGNISIVNNDVVDISNLHRQVIFKEKDIGKSKAKLAEIVLQELNSGINIYSHTEMLSPNNATRLFQNKDLIIDGSDNFQTRYLANDICCQLGLPLISASVYQSQIQIIQMNPQYACYRCVFPMPPPPTLIENCAISGIIGATAGIAGSMAASMAIQILTSPKNFNSQLIRFDSDTYSIDHLEILPQDNCPACMGKLISWPAFSYKVDINNIHNIKEYLVVDLREMTEDRSKILNGPQQHLPFSSFLQNPEQLPNMKILFYCVSGTRSDYAAQLMRSKGFEAWSSNL